MKMTYMQNKDVFQVFKNQ